MTETEPKSRHKVPALVVSGFLGSGKTTLVRRLLEAATADGLRVAFVSNELGALGVDRALLGRGDEAYVELEGGCVCCELSDELVDTLQMLWERVHPDRVVVETSGVALPWDTQLNLWRDPVREWIGEDLAVVVVNAEQLMEGRDLEGLFEDQVASADLLLLNKIDLVPQSCLDGLEARLRSIEQEAPIVRCRYGDVDPVLLFPPDPGELDRNAPTPDRSARAPDRAYGPRAAHDHDHFEAREWRPRPGASVVELEAELRQPDLLRAKGFVETAEGLRLVQVVGRRIELSEVETPPDPALIGRLVLIRRVPR